MGVRVGINGFGRTGRAFYRAANTRDLGIDVVAINDLAKAEDLARLLRYDSVHGRAPFEVKAADSELITGSEHVRVLSETDPARLPWDDLEVQVVVESSGRFTTREKAARHLVGGALRVVVSAPCKGADATFVMGVNEDRFDAERHRVVSNASCTTNCLVPMAKVLDEEFGIENGLMSTVHAYTADQMLVDGLHKDPPRGRAAGVNIVPTSTGAARATGFVLDGLGGRLDGVALRVPVVNGSLTDLVAFVRSAVTVEAVNAAFRYAAASERLGRVLEYAEEPLVSTDVIGSPSSCIVDSQLTMVSGQLVKVFGWYDNEWGYANRLAELTALVGSARP
jgi:glyceraldehyde 3-phosphate dehydrogenase